MKTRKYISITNGMRLTCIALFMFCSLYSNAQNKNKEKHEMVVLPDDVRKKTTEQERLNELNTNKNTVELNSSKSETKENTDNNRRQRDKNRIAATLPHLLNKEDSARIAKKRADYLLIHKETDNSK